MGEFFIGLFIGVLGTFTGLSAYVWLSKREKKPAPKKPKEVKHSLYFEDLFEDDPSARKLRADTKRRIKAAEKKRQK